MSERQWTGPTVFSDRNSLPQSNTKVLTEDGNSTVLTVSQSQISVRTLDGGGTIPGLPAYRLASGTPVNVKQVEDGYVLETAEGAPLEVMR